jgi:sugar-phosphatase
LQVSRITVFDALRTLDAVLFDLDGVLVDSHTVVERTWRRWAALRGLEVPDLVSRAHGRRSIETVRNVAPHLDAAEEVRWLSNAELVDFDGVVALPGALAALASLSDGQVAIVTSGGRELAQRRLKQAGLPIPRVLAAAEDVREGKPSPEGYLTAARHLGVVPSRCIVFEDTPPGVDAGRAAGATVIALSTTFPKKALAAADAVLHTLASVRIVQTQGGLTIQVDEGVA